MYKRINVEKPATPEPAWTIPSSKVSDVENNWATAKGNSPALSISKMKDASYPNFGLELLVPKQMWIDDVCTYDISAKYDISHWWFNRHNFYIDRHDSPSHKKEVKSHMWILSVVRIKAYSRYGYDYLSEIILRRADLQEHTIAEKDFENLYPGDFEDLNLLLLQGHLNHLPSSEKRMLSTAVKLWTQKLVTRQRVKNFQLGIKSDQTQPNLTKPGCDATGYEFKHDYTIIESPRANCSRSTTMNEGLCGSSGSIQDEVGSRELASTNVVLAITEKIQIIRERLKEAQDRWKSYVHKRRRGIEFNVGDFVMLKFSPWKGVMRFKNKGKLSPRFLGPFKILKRIGEVAYVLELPKEMKGVHNTFYVSYLRKCLADESSMIALDELEISPELTFQEEPIAVLKRKSRQLQNKEIPLVKVECKHQKGTSIRWEPEEKMRIMYP
nr:hypothetical protein [Tanacetum cinerariifolium]